MKVCKHRDYSYAYYWKANATLKKCLDCGLVTLVSKGTIAKDIKDLKEWQF